MMSSFWTLAIALLHVHSVQFVSSEDFEWKDIQEIQTWYDDTLAAALSKWWGGSENSLAVTKEFADSIKMGSDFEEYILDARIAGRDNWTTWITDKNAPKYVKSMNAYFDIKYWHARHVSVQFFYLYEFVDGAQRHANGEITSVWNKNGELIKWIYFANPTTFGAVFAYMDELAQSDTKEDL
eukprot:203043_1